MRTLRLATPTMILLLGWAFSLPVPPELLAQSPPVLQVSPTNLTFEGRAGGPPPDPQYLTIANAGGGMLRWQASADVNWIVLGATGGKLSGGREIQLLILVETEGLDAGEYQGTITIEDPNAQGSPAQVAVTLTLTAPPRLEVSPASLSFSGQEGGADPTSQTLTIRNTGGKPLSWTAQVDATWIDLSRTQGELQAGASQSVAVTVRIAGLSAGTHRATITITASEAQNSPVWVPVTLTVEPSTPWGLVMESSDKISVEIHTDKVSSLTEHTAPSEFDSDGDGVPDAEDYCPLTPGRPENNGCP